MGLDEKRWWLSVSVTLIVLALAVAVDHPVSLWAQSLPQPIREALQNITPYGESDWILYPAGGLFAITALVALVVRWKLMRTMLWQFAALYAFIFLGVGVPSLISTLSKRLIGRGRPAHFDETGLFGVRWNWWDWTYQSFPSGHATTAFALAAAVGFISPRWFYPAIGLASVIGLSRITEGVHYPSDVFAGALLGLVGAYAVRLFFAQRGWLFGQAQDGRIAMRPMSSLKRYLTLKRRGIAPKPQPDRP
jgi:membrane-associated phospholipid phosphatase